MNIFKHTASRVWFIVTAIIVVLFLAVNIVVNTLLYDIVCQAIGGIRPILAESEEGKAQYYEAEFETKEDARKNGEAVNEEVTAEGMVLLKNENGALPLASGAKVSVFGKNSVDIVTGGTGSAAGSGKYVKGLDESLKEAGFQVNQKLWEFYKDPKASGSGRSTGPELSDGSSSSTLLTTGETPYASYTEEVKSSYAEYSDAAIIVFSRIGGESWDLPRAMTGMTGARNDDDHYLQLDQNETDLIKNVCEAGFRHVIVLLNSSTTLEAGFLDDVNHYAYNSKIDAAIWMGVPGDTGVMSLGKILKGEINPSGRTPDTYSRNFKNDPTWQNFGDNNASKGGNYVVNSSNKISNYNYAFVDYEEGIYVGYKYFETRAVSEDENWYSRNVVYPFGYGKSYTTFSQEIKNGKVSALSLDKDGKGSVTLEVEVKNTGDVAGKDAVQIYVTPPYTAGGIEKSHVVLAGFAKTEEIQPGKSAKVEITVDLYDVASYDYNDANKNGHTGYELEAGTYTFSLRNNSHDVIESFDASLSETYNYNADPATGYEVKNRFEDADDELKTVLSRNDWSGTFPTARTEEEKNLSEEKLSAVNSTEHNNPNTYTEKPVMGAAAEYDEEGNQLYTFRSLVGVDYDDEETWDKVLNQITFDEMKDLVNKGAFKTVQIESIGKAESIDADGPAGFADFVGNEATSPIYEVTHYCCEPLMAATFSVALLEKVGTAVGNEALVGNLRGGGMPYSGWYAPGMNIHRSPFGGRTGEYFSEDSYLTGMLGAAEIKGAMSKGVYTQVKHFAVNEQETNRNGVCTWLNEQSLREIYLRPFEKAVKVGGTRGMMSSFNRIGNKWTGGDYRLLTEVLRNEWGFRGMVISDYLTSSYTNAKQEAYAGGDLGLNGPVNSWSPSKTSAADLNVLRNCVKNILYTTVNSNLMNAEVLGYKMPYWQIALIAVDCVLAVGLAVWGVFAIRSAGKKR